MAKYRQNRNQGSATLFLAEVGVAAALAFILSRLKIYQMPQGGSISLEMLPVLFIAFLRGPRQGAAAGVVTGLLKLVFGGYVAHPVQAILDYPLGSMVLGLAPLFAMGGGATRVITGTVGGAILQLACYVVSGAVFFAAYAPEGISPWKHSLVYNATVVVPEAVISGLIAAYLVNRSGVLRRKGRGR